MNTEGRMTRARARVLEAGGQTPLMADLPAKTPAKAAPRTTRKTNARTQEPLGDATNTATASESTAMKMPAAMPEPAVQERAAASAAPLAQAAAASQPAAEEPPAPAAEGSRDPDTTLAAAPAEEPPATPSASVPASPKGPTATPTGLGLSSLPPISPMSGVLPQSNTPAATPLAGVPVPVTTRVTDALQAAAQVLGNGQVQAAPAGEQPAAGAGDSGFGSPVRTSDSPDLPVSVGAAASPAPMAVVPGAEAMSVSPGLGPLRFGADDYEDLISMLRTPVTATDEDEDTSDGPMGADMRAPAMEQCQVELVQAPMAEQAPTPTLGAGLPSATAEQAVARMPTLGAGQAQASEGKAPTPLVVRKVAGANPLTPSHQVLLEAEEQDFVTEAGEPEHEAQPASAGASPMPMDAMEDAQAHQDHEAAAAAAALRSKVVVASPASFDPRSLRTLRKEVAARLEAKHAADAWAAAAVAGRGDVLAAGAVADSDEEEAAYVAEEYGEVYAEGYYGEEEADGNEDGEGYEHGVGSQGRAAFNIGVDATGDALEAALGALSLGHGRGPLRGLPTPAGVHIRFDDDGEPDVSPGHRLRLRGLPEPEGKHIRFED